MAGMAALKTANQQNLAFNIFFECINIRNIFSALDFGHGYLRKLTNDE